MIRNSLARGLLYGSAAALVLAMSPATPAEEVAAETLALCTSCHGEQGLPSDPAVPILWGQEFYYLYVQLKDYKAGRRANPVMSAIAAALSKEQMQALAQHFSQQPWPATGYSADEADIARAKSAAVAGLCTQCHLGAYTGNSRVPRLAGQQVAYLKQTMLDFKHKVRLNSPAKGSLLAAYDDRDIEALARYLGDL